MYYFMHEDASHPKNALKLIFSNSYTKSIAFEISELAFFVFSILFFVFFRDCQVNIVVTTRLLKE